jgi:hypothetical protein
LLSILILLFKKGFMKFGSAKIIKYCGLSLGKPLDILNMHFRGHKSRTLGSVSL